MRKTAMKSLMERVAAATIAATALVAAWNGIAPARDRQAETCLSNLRRLGLAARMYSDDFDGYLTPYCNTSTGYVVSGLLLPYVGDRKYFACPSDHLDRSHNNMIPTQVPTTYGVSWRLTNACGAFNGNRLTSAMSSSIKNPSGTVWMADTALITTASASLPADQWQEDLKNAPASTFYFFYLPQDPTTGASTPGGWSTPTGWMTPDGIVRPFPRHHGMVNCTFFDGHAAAVPGKAFDPDHNPDAAWGKPGCLWDNVAG